MQERKGNLRLAASGCFFDAHKRGLYIVRGYGFQVFFPYDGFYQGLDSGVALSGFFCDFTLV